MFPLLTSLHRSSKFQEQLYPRDTSTRLPRPNTKKQTRSPPRSQPRHVLTDPTPPTPQVNPCECPREALGTRRRHRTARGSAVVKGWTVSGLALATETDTEYFFVGLHTPFWELPLSNSKEPHFLCFLCFLCSRELCWPIRESHRLDLMNCLGGHLPSRARPSARV